MYPEVRQSVHRRGAIERSTRLATVLAALLILTTAGPTAAGAALFGDDFDGSGLDLSRWTVVEGRPSRFSVSGDVLTLEGAGGPQGDHKSIDSVQVFGTGVVARARILFGDGDYQAFGFNRSMLGDFGVYFDTGTDGQLHAQLWVSGAFVYSEALGDYTGAWHEYAVTRTDSDVIFAIDGKEVGRSPFASADPKPISITNDREPAMTVDWVEVMAVDEPLPTASEGACAQELVVILQDGQEHRFSLAQVARIEFRGPSATPAMPAPSAGP